MLWQVVLIWKALFGRLLSQQRGSIEKNQMHYICLQARHNSVKILTRLKEPDRVWWMPCLNDAFESFHNVLTEDSLENNDFPLNYKSLGWEGRQCECCTINSIYSTASGAKEQVLTVKTYSRFVFDPRMFWLSVMRELQYFILNYFFYLQNMLAINNRNVLWTWICYTGNLYKNNT